MQDVVEGGVDGADPCVGGEVEVVTLRHSPAVSRHDGTSWHVAALSALVALFRAKHFLVRIADRADEGDARLVILVHALQRVANH